MRGSAENLDISVAPRPRPNGECYNWDVIRRDARRSQLLIKANIRITVNSRNYAYLFTVCTERYNVRYNLRPIRMTKRRVIYENVFGGDTFVF